MSKLTPIASNCSEQEYETASLVGLPSLQTLEPPILDQWPDWWMSCLADFRVSPTQWQGNSEDLTMSGTFGLTRSELSVRWSQDGSYWKTSQVSFLHLLTGEDQRMGEPWSESLPPSGTVSIGKQSVLTMWAHPTVESDGGALLWRTPAQQEPGINPERLEGEQGHRMYDKETGRLAQYGLTQQAQMQQWPTPSAEGSAGEISEDLVRRGQKLVNSKTGRVLQTNLATEARQGTWPTPVADDTGNRQKKYAQGGTPLSMASGNWPTPTATERENDTTATPSEATLERFQKGEIARVRKTRAPTLTSAVQQGEAWATSQHGPLAQAMPTHGSKSSESDPTSPRPSPKRLNSNFVAWIMGVPIGWTSLKPLATESYQQWWQSFSGG